jgi:hypothetical protein
MLWCNRMAENFPGERDATLCWIEFIDPKAECTLPSIILEPFNGLAGHHFRSFAILGLDRASLKSVSKFLGGYLMKRTGLLLTFAALIVLVGVFP